MHQNYKDLDFLDSESVDHKINKYIHIATVGSSKVCVHAVKMLTTYTYVYTF